MNQCIKIRYKPQWNPNYWDIWFRSNNKSHREKAPSWLDSDEKWVWHVNGNFQKIRYNFDWNSK